jgi:hypothetical protein
MVRKVSMPTDPLFKLDLLLLDKLVSPALPSKATIQLGGPEDISVSQWKAKTPPPSKKMLLDLSSSPEFQTVLDAAEEVGKKYKLGRLRRESVWIRVHRELLPTKEHTDIGFFSKSLRKERGLKGSCCCCFCGADAVGDACQRCFSGGLTTLWIPLHRLDAEVHSMLHFPLHTPTCPSLEFGDALLFLGDEPHMARVPGMNRGMDSDNIQGQRDILLPRISLDVRFVSNDLPSLYVAPSDMKWIEKVRNLFKNDDALFKRESCNYDFLLGILGFGLDKKPAWTYRNVGCRADDGPRPDPGADCGALVLNWLHSRKKVATILKNYEDAAIKISQRFLLDPDSWFTSNGKMLRLKNYGLAYLLTHFVFVVTDYLVAPWRWPRKKYPQVEMAIVMLSERLELRTNPEVFLETMGCVVALHFCKKSLPLRIIEEVDVEEAVKLEISRRRRSSYPSDIEAHTYFLWVWFQSLKHA